MSKQRKHTSEGRHPKKLTLDITFYDTASLDDLLYKLKNGMFPLGPVYVNVNGAAAVGSITYAIPLQEPKEEVINNQRCFVYRSNM